MDEAALSDLIDFVAGRGRWAAFGRGISSYPDGDANNRKIHEACLELERRGLIRRRRDESSRAVSWVPAEAEV